MARVVVTPGGDPAAKTAASWAAGIAAANVLAGAQADLQQISQCCAPGNGDHIVYFGHGQRDRWLRYDWDGVNRINPQTILSTSDLPVPQFRAAGFVAIACLSGQQLGLSVRSHGASYYVGFRQKLRFRASLSSHVGRCVHDVVTHCLKTTQTPAEADLKRIVDRHIKLWRDRGRSPHKYPEAQPIIGYLNDLLSVCVHT